MKRLQTMFVVILAVLLLLPAASIAVEVPKIPIIYPGDTDETIVRRAKWIEGAKKEGVLSWWGITRPPEAMKVINAFNKIYPFIRVDYWRGEGEEIATKLEMKFLARSPSTDISLGGEPINFPRWRKMGLMQPFADIIPGIKSWDKRRYSAFGDAVQPGNNAITPQYNTDLVSENEVPKNWEDLLDPKWKGQIGLPTDPKTWWTLSLAEGGWGIEKTIDFVTKLKAQDPVMCKGMSAGHTLLIAGEFKIYANDYLRHVLVSKRKGAPVDWVRVSPVPVTGPYLFFPAYSAHPNARRLFVEWFLSKEGARLYEEITFYAPAFPGTGTRLSKALEGSNLVVRTEEVMIGAAEKRLHDRFSEILMMK